MKTDFLVIGSGIAGLSFAIKAAKKFPQKTVTIVTKSDENESNTKYAQGGIAAVMDTDKDSFEKHIEDTMIAGDFLSDKEIVKLVVETGPDRIKELIEWGTEFDKNEKGKIDLALEGGHSSQRIAHHKDITGFEIERALLNEAHNLDNVTILEHHFAVDLITDHHIKHKITKPVPGLTCYGGYVLNSETKKIEKYLAKIVLLATGGLGQVYQNTVNPIIATGDGIAMAYRAKAEIEDMEFIQFHPTGLYNPGETPSFLISEAVRGFGAKLKNQKGEEFMINYDKRKELAPRDVVARAIDSEMKRTGGEFVNLDCTHLNQKKFVAHFPNITKKCKSIGIDVTKDYIPIVPTAHYLCGGIKTDINGKTTIKNLYASGECAKTGLHGGNRLASNSLLEGLVFSHQAYKDITDKIDGIEYKKEVPNWDAQDTAKPKEKVLVTYSRKELQTLMSFFMGIVRSDYRLEKAMRRLEMLYEETEDLYERAELSPELCELRNMVASAYLIVRQSMERQQNAGGFYNIDLQ